MVVTEGKKEELKTKKEMEALNEGLISNVIKSRRLAGIPER